MSSTAAAMAAAPIRIVEHENDNGGQRPTRYASGRQRVQRSAASLNIPRLAEPPTRRHVGQPAGRPAAWPSDWLQQPAGETQTVSGGRTRQPSRWEAERTGAQGTCRRHVRDYAGIPNTRSRRQTGRKGRSQTPMATHTSRWCALRGRVIYRPIMRCKTVGIE